MTSTRSTSSRPVSISVVVPSAGRPQLLDRCLRGVAASADRLERVVVVHSGDGDTREVVDRWRGRMSLHDQRGEQLGVSARRNQGWLSCDSDVIAFTDDDCEPTAGWADAIAASFVASDVDVVQGKVLPHPEDAGVSGTFARTVRLEARGDLFVGANLAVRRAALERVDGFDTGLHGGEDTDLAWRVIGSAASPEAAAGWSADALVWHAVRAVRFVDHLRSIPRWSSLPVVVRRHTALRRHLTAGVFWKPEHVTALVALLGVVGATWNRRNLLLTTPHLWRRIKPHGAYAGTELAISDIVEVAVLATGSVRHGSLLL